MDQGAIHQPGSHVSCVAEAGKIHVAGILEGQAGQDGDAVVALLPARNHVAIAEGGKLLERNFVHRAFALLQAQDVGGLFLKKFGDEIGPQSD